MTVPRTPALEIQALSPNGSGLALPVAKALAHMMTAHAACVREDWPITATQLRAELTEAVSHLNTLSLSHELFTEELAIEIQSWTDNVVGVHRNFIVNDPEAAPHADQVAELQDLITLTWSLLTLIDREITGLPATQADPGLRP